MQNCLLQQKENVRLSSATGGEQFLSKFMFGMNDQISAWFLVLNQQSIVDILLTYLHIEVQVCICVYSLSISCNYSLQ